MAGTGDDDITWGYLRDWLVRELMIDAELIRGCLRLALFRVRQPLRKVQNQRAQLGARLRSDLPGGVLQLHLVVANFTHGGRHAPVESEQNFLQCPGSGNRVECAGIQVAGLGEHRPAL